MTTDNQDLTDAQILRMKAESKIRVSLLNEKNQVEESDVMKLIHELQVHQIELEMQNEQLNQAYEATGTALKKYTMLYDFAPMGYFTLDREGRIGELNFTAAEMLGDKRFALINSNIKLYISETSLPVFKKFFAKVYSGCSKESCKVVFGGNEGPSCSVYMEGILTGDDQQCLVSVVDLSDFNKGD